MKRGVGCVSIHIIISDQPISSLSALVLKRLFKLKASCDRICGLSHAQLTSAKVGWKNKNISCANLINICNADRGASLFLLELEETGFQSPARAHGALHHEASLPSH